MSIHSNQILLIQSGISTFFSSVLLIVKDPGWVLHSWPRTFIITFIFILVYLIFIHTAFDLIPEAREELSKTPKTIGGYVFKYRILVFFNLVYYGIELFYLHYTHHQLHFY